MEITLQQALALVDMFSGDEEITISLTENDGRILAHNTEYPEDGATDL